MILLIDNYDSFIFNIMHYLQELQAEVRVERNDAMTADAFMALAPDAVILSPGPCTPDDAGVTLELIGCCADAGIPLLGICLGHQAIGQHFGAHVVRGGLLHGKVSEIHHDGTGVFRALPSPFRAARYHSLCVNPETIPANLSMNAQTDDGVIMGFRHKSHQIHGIQFHPESIATEYGHALLRNFLTIVRKDHREVAI